MILTTKVLDRVAFYQVFGGKIISVTGHYPENEFVVEVSKWVRAYEIIGGWVPYNRFCNERRRIKRLTRRLAGLPEYFTGNKNTGFRLGDIATYKPWSKREIKLGLDKDNTK